MNDNGMNGRFEHVTYVEDVENTKTLPSKSFLKYRPRGQWPNKDQRWGHSAFYAPVDLISNYDLLLTSPRSAVAVSAVHHTSIIV